MGRKKGTYFTRGGRVFDSEGIKIEGGRERNEEKEMVSYHLILLHLIFLGEEKSTLLLRTVQSMICLE
jgi:hypothetical protein